MELKLWFIYSCAKSQLQLKYPHLMSNTRHVWMVTAVCCCNFVAVNLRKTYIIARRMVCCKVQLWVIHFTMLYSQK